MEQLSKELHKPAKKKFETSGVRLKEIDEIWGADLVEEQASDETFDLPIIEPHKLHEVMAEQNESTDKVVDIKAENLFDHIDEEESRSAPEDFPSDVMDDVIGPIETMDPVQVAPIELGDDFEQKLKEKLTPVVEEFVKEYCRESVEKIAWEIIPELAENLIKKEIQKITESVLKSQV